MRGVALDKEFNGQSLVDAYLAAVLSYEASPSTGGILQEPAFQSTAGGRKPFGRDSLIVYKLAAGHPGRDIGKAGLSKLGYEGEVLFPPLTRYRIEDVVQKADVGELEFEALLSELLAEPEYAWGDYDYRKVQRVFYATVLPT
jgi:hypothetical protein